jgi:hypothetical protein
VEPQMKEIEQEVMERIGSIGLSAPFTLVHNAGFSMAKCCYGLCRALRPRVVLETGVAYGVTSAFILKALKVNGEGTLHSIDLPPLGRDADSFVGALIPAELRKEWKLHRGVSKRVMPRLLTDLSRVELFLHDSLHTFSNVKRELSLVTPYLARPAVVMADDIQEHGAFLEWAQQTEPDSWFAVCEQQKEALFGVAVFR